VRTHGTCCRVTTPRNAQLRCAVPVCPTVPMVVSTPGQAWFFRYQLDRELQDGLDAT
jgi:hypothetical protein